MKKLFFATLVVLASGLFKSQKIFSVDYESQANVKVFIVQYESQADLKVFKVKYESQAGQNDGKRFFTDYASKRKKDLFCEI